MEPDNSKPPEPIQIVKASWDKETLFLEFSAPPPDLWKQLFTHNRFVPISIWSPLELGKLDAQGKIFIVPCSREDFENTANQYKRLVEQVNLHYAAQVKQAGVVLSGDPR